MPTKEAKFASEFTTGTAIGDAKADSSRIHKNAIGPRAFGMTLPNIEEGTAFGETLNSLQI